MSSALPDQTIARPCPGGCAQEILLIRSGTPRYKCRRSAYGEKIPVRSLESTVDRGWLVHERNGGANGTLARGEGERLVRATAVAGWKQLRTQVGDQPVGNVAGGDL